jgi:hypothetical protein
VKPPPGWRPQHRRGTKRTSLPYRPVPDPACIHGLLICDAHTYRPEPAATRAFQKPEWSR